MRLRIRSKLIIGIAVTIFIFGSAATYSVFRLVKDVIVEKEKGFLLSSVMSTAHELYQVFLWPEDLVETISRQDKIINFFNDPNSQDSEILKKLQGYNIGDKFSAIYLMDAEGKTWVSTDESFVGKNYAFRTYFKEALRKNERVVDMAVGVTSKQPGYYLASPIASSTGAIVGVAVVKMKPEFINNVFNSDTDAEGHYMFTDNYGVIIFSDKTERIYSSLGILSDKVFSKINSEKKFPEIDIKPLNYNSVQGIVNNYEKSEVIQFFDKADKEEEIVAVAKVGDLPFYLTNEIEAKNIIEPAYKIALTLSLFVLGAAIMATFFITLLVTRFLLPLAKFKKSVGEISSGNLEETVKVDTRDELYDLAEDFNKMVDKINKNKKEIEKKVEERTKDLEKINRYMTGRELRMIELKEKIKELEAGKSQVEKTWKEKYQEAISLEEDVIEQLESVYISEIKKAKISPPKKKKALKLMRELISDSKRHDKLFQKLIKKEDVRK